LAEEGARHAVPISEPSALVEFQEAGGLVEVVLGEARVADPGCEAGVSHFLPDFFLSAFFLSAAALVAALAVSVAAWNGMMSPARSMRIAGWEVVVEIMVVEIMVVESLLGVGVAVEVEKGEVLVGLDTESFFETERDLGANNPRVQAVVIVPLERSLLAERFVLEHGEVEKVAPHPGLVA
jgi:hypothetical protein